MSVKVLLFNVHLRSRFQSIGARWYCAKITAADKVLESADEEPLYVEEEADPAELNRKRNKSRLSTAHRNVLLEQRPYDESIEWYHDTVKYKKRILGRYGMKALGVPAGLAWPTPQEVEEAKEYENFKYPRSIQDRFETIMEQKKKEEEATMARQEHIAAKMANMEQLINDVQARIAKKQEQELEAKLRKERKIEEIRRQLIGEGILGKEKLAEALSLAEKEEKKKKKEAKKAKLLEREKKLIERLTVKQHEQQNTEEPEGNEAEAKKE
ncbi:growth arrest and DNA damage-inducible proteins-interacting protein 1 [Ceratina calcarata]|uniref:Large ribosomal subunit protein mL64 n=1 Tax=Ceratina calcarata TaxID=156304 RepID=A0AAJ7J305_9HYME|nr:growth arrest and DNA damage-inducible proteins-interacting protein 1 [Ceratina calcarata]